MSDTFTPFHSFTAKQKIAVNLMIDLHTLNRDDIGDRVSKYIMDKLVDMGVFDYDTSDEFWDFTNSFFDALVDSGVIDRKSGERVNWSVETGVNKTKAQEAPKDAPPSNESALENVVTDDTKQGVTGVFETPLPLNNEWVCKDRDNEGNYYTQITGRCEACDELVEHHYALCYQHLSEEVTRIGEDAYAIYGLPSGTIPHLVQKAIDEVAYPHNSEDIPF